MFGKEKKDKRFEVLKTNLLEWKDLWLLAGFTYYNDVDQSSEFIDYEQKGPTKK